jgi:hypothetical protein
MLSHGACLGALPQFEIEEIRQRFPSRSSHFVPRQTFVPLAKNQEENSLRKRRPLQSIPVTI